jgi:membrane associated rhomboid family serine protease
MLRQKWGSVVCPSCGQLVGVNDEQCLNCGRRNPGMWGFAPFLSRWGRDVGFTQVILAGCVALYVISLVIDIGGIRMSGFLNILSPSSRALFLLGDSGTIPVFGFGRWWTVLSAGWLHGGLLHILFNMMVLRQFGPTTSEFYGSSRMAIIYTIAGATGFLASTFAGTLVFLPSILRGAGFTVGASAGICGLAGALLYYGKRTGSRMVSEQIKSWLITIFLFGFFIGGIDNWAHLGGLLGGYGTAKILDPLKPERLDHLVGALVCLAVTVIAIVFSVVHGLALL